MVDDAFGNWLAGFLDGEGHFAIYPNGKTGAYATRASISLRLDDIQILREIQQRTGLGTIQIQSHKTLGPHWQTTWAVQSKKDCRVLCGILDRHPLRAKKARDYAIWREAVHLHSSVRRNRYHPSDWSAMAELASEIRRIRQYESAEEIVEVPPPPQLKLAY